MASGATDILQTTIFTPGNFVATNNAQQQNACNVYNAQQVALYTQAMANYNGFIDAVGTLPPGPVPVPAMAQALSAPDANGLQWETTGTTPVCPAIPVHQPIQNNTNTPPIKNHIHVGHATASPGWFSVGLDDGVVPGMTVPATSDDGVSGMFEKFSAPVGQGWYLKVA